MSVDRPSVIPPGATIGIIGGGQLGRMTALAAARLGYRCHVFCPEADCPASHVATATVAAYEDREALARFAELVDVVTFEFENIPAESVRVLSQRVTVRPGWRVLETAQDRVVEKSFFNAIGVETAGWRPVADRTDLERAVAELGRPSVLKTARFGYDGKGQVKIDATTSLDEAWAEMKGVPAILESFVGFEREASVIVARGADGTARCFDVVENRHRNHILDQTIAPAPVTPALALRAEEIALRTAEKLELVGLLAVELFVTPDGRLLANEMAPRPHNSGHWTMDACATDQFEQLVRAVCGLPLGSTERHLDAVMTNLIGDDINQWLSILSEPDAHLHLYGKREARTGRKMGHVTRVFSRNDEAGGKN
ncbi:5-(carboxyamino)imidazole ribonucleotide synthase [Telmatospirillum siberiense]|uniref:N5-carboxyaminoimidazole ribonucleotide synthase n=1 Tax=Telmatospirillum siberiense TaxID=382514 RepID=A0A2N3Q138_9PROT|nr:5-(carboxyamino)imidazole ribonucleotide synthase [Telmatospirillum siberiense]PKU26301.1 5-(carboxyamino)imidazole ribonucleotide synthase [Telmatospirillum siberiense]